MSGINIAIKEGVEDFLISDMCRAIEHRGPDDQKEYKFGDIEIGYVHNAVQGIHRNQEREDVICLIDGKIINKEDLMNEIGKEENFINQEDLVNLVYSRYNTKFLEHLNGMFSIVIYDKKQDLLIVARDRLGIKPLYYYCDNDCILFSSEIKGILADKSIKRKLNEEALIDYLMNENNIDDKTLFEGIKHLLPGYYALYQDKKLKLVRYWDVELIKEDLDSIGDYVKGFRELFDNAVVSYLSGTKRLGFHLSGGFDSSSIAVIASKQINEKIKTFTIGFPDLGEDYCEFPFSRAVAKEMNSEHHELTVDAQDIMKALPQILYYLEEPSKIGPAVVPLYFLNKEMSNYAKVTVSGTGDGLFSDSLKNKLAYFKKKVIENPIRVFSFFKLFNKSELKEVFSILLGSILVKERRNFFYINFDGAARKRILTRDFYNRIKNYNPLKTVENVYKHKGFDYFDLYDYFHFKTYMVSLFHNEDKLASAHSLEVRMPYTDYRLVDFLVSIPQEYKIYSGEARYVLKESMKGELPEILYKHKKIGFYTPIKVWFKKELREYVEEILLSDRVRERGIFSAEGIKKLIRDFQRGKMETISDYARHEKIWALLNIELWFRIFIDEDETLTNWTDSAKYNK